MEIKRLLTKYFMKELESWEMVASVEKDGPFWIERRSDAPEAHREGKH